ncbi:uncharacterized protein LOC110460349, partial [Mizuhopecten yessoensis]|uniref:uncharacterized protein LOC110460349 n=1 Tax=Mizuhopecten yessoensis TaxID=6573 RepID=UPI000B45DD23
MNRQHYSSDNSSDLETSPSDIIEIEGFPVKSKKKKKKKTFSFDSNDNASTSSSPKHSKQGKVRKSTTGDKSTYSSIPSKTTGKASKSTTGDKSTYRSIPSKTTGKVNKSLTNISGDRGVKRKTTSSSNREGPKHAKGDGGDTSSDDELTGRSASTGKRVRRGLAKRLYGNNSQASEVLLSGSGTASQDGWYSTTKAPQPSTSHTSSQTSTTDSHKPNSQISTRDSHKPNSKISSRRSHARPVSAANTYSFIKLSSDSDVVKEAVEPPRKKCITYHDSDPGSEGFDPSISDEAMGQLSSGNSSDDLFVTQTSAGRKSLPKKMVSSDESTIDSDITIMDSPVHMEAHMMDSDATINDSPMHKEVPDTQLPDLTLKFMSSSSEEEPDRNIIYTSRQKSDSSERPYHHIGKQGVDQLAHHTTSHTNKNSQGSRTARNSGESQESESLFGKPPSSSQHIQDDPYKFPSQDKTQSMPSLHRMSYTSKPAILGSEVKQELVTDLETTTDSDADVPLASLSVDKYKTKSTGRSSIKRGRDNMVDDGNSDFNLWPQSSKRFRQGCYSQNEENESATQNYSLGQETIHNQSGGPDIKSEVEDSKNNSGEILIPKIEPPSYGYTQDLDVMFIEDSDSDYEDMSQKIVEISSDEDDKLPDFDDAEEFKAYFNLPDCDSDDNDLQVLGQRRDEDASNSSAASNIDWVSVDSDDDLSYGLLTQQADVNSSIYDQPTQVDTADTESRVRFIEEVVTFDESDDENDDPYEKATQVDGAEEESTVDEMCVYTADTQVDHVGITESDEDLYNHCTQIDHPKDKRYKQHNRYSTHTKVAGQQEGGEPGEMDSVYSMDTQLDDVRSHGGSDGEMDSIYSADTQLDIDHRPEVYIDVDDKEEVYVKVEVIDTADPHRQHTEIDPYNFCVPVDRSLMVNVKPKHHKLRMAQTNVIGHGTRSDEEDDIYTAQTQIDGAGVIRGTADEEEDIYTAQTQIDGAGIIHGTDDEEDGIYTAQTQIDGAGLICDKGDGEVDVYTAQTRVDGVSMFTGTDDKGDGEVDAYTAQTQVDGVSMFTGTDDKGDGEVDAYTAQTQVDGVSMFTGTDDKEEGVYARHTHPHRNEVKGHCSRFSKGEDIGTNQTQEKGLMSQKIPKVRFDSEKMKKQIMRARLQISNKEAVNRTKGLHLNELPIEADVPTDKEQIEHPYLAATQIDGGDPYLAATQIDGGDPYLAATQIEGGGPYLAATQTDGGDPYLAATQMDDGAALSSRSDEDKDLYMANTQIDNITISSTEDVSEKLAGDITISSTEEDTHMDVEPGEQEDTEPFNIATQYDLPVESSLTPSDKYREIEKSLVKSIDKIRFQNLISFKKTVLPTEPERLKTTAEKIESFRIEKSTFYSKKSIDMAVQHQDCKKPSSATSGWLSTSTSVNSRTLPKMKGSRSKRQQKVQLDNSQQIKDKMSVARTQMSNRQQKSVKPTAHRNTSLTASTGYDTDVQLPNHEEILAKQLPLLTVVVPTVRHTADKQSFHLLNSTKNRSSTEAGSSKKDNGHKEGSLKPEAGSSKRDSKNKERSQSTEPGSSKHDSKNKERSQSTESGSSKHDNRNKERSHSTEPGSNKHDIRNKERSQSTEPESSRHDSRNKERSQSTEPGSSKHDSKNKERSQSTESGSSKHDNRNKERSQSTKSGSSKHDCKNKERSPRPEPGSGSSKHDSRNKERSQSTEPGSSKHDNKNKERSQSTEPGSSKHDSRNKGRSQSIVPGSSQHDSKNKERSQSTESVSSKKDYGHKKRSPRPESGSSKHDSRNKERSQSKESGSSKYDSRNKERSQSTEPESSQHDSKNKERSQSTKPGLSKHDSRNKERSPRPESGSSKKDIQNREMSSKKYSGSSKNNDRNEERPSRSVNTENHKRVQVIEERSMSLESITSEEINFDENYIPDINSNKEPQDTCLLDGLSKTTGTKENMPPMISVVMSSTASNDVDPVSKSSKPSTTAHDPLPVSFKPRVGKMIRRPATRPKSILSRPENRISKPGRRVVFDLPDKATNKVPVISNLARSILAREERLPQLHHLRRSEKVTNPVGPLNRTEGTIPHVSSFKSAGSMQTPSATQPKGPVPPFRHHNLMEKCNTTVLSQMNRPLTDITGANNTTPDRQYSLDNLLVKLLKWNPVWLQEQERCPDPPPAIEEENPLFSLSESYSHFDDYIRLFTPHTVCGFKKSVESGVTKYRVHLSAVQTSTDKKFLHFTWN